MANHGLAIKQAQMWLGVMDAFMQDIRKHRGDRAASDPDAVKKRVPCPENLYGITGNLTNRVMARYPMSHEMWTYKLYEAFMGWQGKYPSEVIPNPKRLEHLHKKTRHLVSEIISDLQSCTNEGNDCGLIHVRR